MLAAGVDEHGYGAALDYVQAATLQGKSFVYKIVDRRSERELAVEPGFYGVLVGRLNVFEMAGLEGTQMSIHYGRGDGGLAAGAA